MNKMSFLDKLSAEIKTDFPDSLNDLIVVLPNKRAKVFLLEALKKQYAKSLFAPEIISVEELVQEISGIRALDSIELVFEFYEVYRTVVTPEKSQPFEQFANWAKMLLQDFNEIDRYLLNPDRVFSYLKDIEDIKHWSLDLEKRTTMIQNYLEFWEMMPVYYHAFFKYLSDKRVGYQGLIYRLAVDKSAEFASKLGAKKMYFAGFNALNAAEEVIIQAFLERDCAKVFWDIDAVFLDDPYHDAGLFLRRIKRDWKYYRTHPMDWIVNDFSDEKTIRVIKTPKTVGQARIAGKLIEKIKSENQSLNQVALVLGEENLLMPVLYSLPVEVDALNITMGYDGRSNPVQILISKLFKMHLNALRRDAVNYTLYHKEVLDVLSNPMIEPYIDAGVTIKNIHEGNLTFFSLDSLKAFNAEPNILRDLVLTKWETTPLDVLRLLSAIISEIKNRLSTDAEEDKVVKTFLYSMFQLINKLINYGEQYPTMDSIENVYAIYKQVIDLAEVSFEGEPLKGLQIMGVLESRVLDFDTVIITSVNEGKFPAGKSQNSFIPYDVKRELGLPTYKEKDAIYSYHFYHLLLRAKNVYLLYNSEAEGLDAGERSRFITQLEIEKRPNHHLEHLTYAAFLPEKAYQPIEVPKSKLLQEKLREIASERGFSPSALTNYLRNPIQFYLQRVLRIREVDEVEESVALNTLGTIIHNALEELYKPLVGRILTVSDLDDLQKRSDAVVEVEFEKEYSSNKDKLGKNLLAFEVAKRNVFHFLMEERKNLLNGDVVQILELERLLEYQLIDERLPYPVNLFGYVDRIEIRNEAIRVIDYKSGKVESNQLRLKNWEGLTTELKNDKIIQLLCYALMFEEEAAGRALEAGIYSFKNRKEGFLFFGVRQGREVDQVITTEVLAEFRTELVSLINTILKADTNFIEELIR
ncbi:PD-(D/E)XK nuclease family protein [Flavobacterium sp. NKUCC04_CG]|uniref:PD-(D/E)XK nuclease family protein n=1 Tax=Flavobacterium sp. NKUCC04_CG TaxID=2842121 RepID=UPI001C5B3523|nr:PD-(D/E)XK nuclease family protein [Flavobacterium sp. NKUCC04_CG]MBW3518486.1 PD-(D/E)XK nuclease family protein [Flavobacterium sp. NKUCC04_CG]